MRGDKVTPVCCGVEGTDIMIARCASCETFSCVSCMRAHVIEVESHAISVLPLPAKTGN